MTITLKQFAALGGKARAAKLTPERIKEIASNAGKARQEKRRQQAEACKQAQSVPD